MTQLTRSYAVFFFLFLINSFLINAQNFQTKSVSIFKNGQSFFIKEGKVNPENGVWTLPEKEVPPALFGTLWFNSEASEIDFVKSYPDTITNSKTQITANLMDLLYLNKDKKMTLHLKNEKILTGVIEQMEETKNLPNQFGNIQSIPSILIFKTAEEWVTLYPSQIERIDFQEAPNFLKEFENKMLKSVVELGFANNKTEQSLEMMYLRNGLVWAPEYLLELKSDTKATLTLQAEIANNGEDLEEIEMNLVVGVPNFKYGDRQAFLVDFLKQVSPKDFNTFSNVANPFATQNIGYGINADFSGNVNQPVDPTGSTNEDLFFYTLDNFSLPKGGRAMQQLFKEEIDIQHIYECNLAENPNNGHGYQFSFSSPDKNNVVHSLKITNRTAQPWTTGSVLVVNQIGKTRPVSQDKLNYTSSKGHSFVKLTEAPDVRVEHSEKEISRENRIKQVKGNGNYWYDLVKVKGQIKIRNYKTKEIDLNIRRKINGILGKSNTDWLKAEGVNRSVSLNKTTNVCWETSVKADEELVVDYEYDVYVRS